jgi:hypothetical protein
MGQNDVAELSGAYLKSRKAEKARENAVHTQQRPLSLWLLPNIFCTLTSSRQYAIQCTSLYEGSAMAQMPTRPPF